MSLHPRFQPHARSDSCRPAVWGARDSRKVGRASGFTLIEVMVVVAIVGILAAVGLPAYSDYVRRGELPEAFSQLSALRVAMEQYYQDNRNYGTNSVCTNNVLKLTPSNASEAKFSYSCTLSGDGQTYTLNATGTSSHTQGHEYTLNESGARSTLKFKGANVNQKTCWLKRGNEC